MIEFSSQLHSGKLLKRYKRFFADVTLDDGTVVVAHCPNTGSMRTCAEAGMQVRLTHNDSPTRKLKYTWELSAGDGGWIGVNTHRVNSIVHRALERGFFSEFSDYPVITPEATWCRGTRFDFALARSESEGPAAYIEVKNVTLLENEAVTFPDSESVRAAKHARELVEVVRSGKRAMLVFIVNRPEGKVFRPAWQIDPNYGIALTEAHHAGVELLAVRCSHDESSSQLTERLVIDLTRPDSIFKTKSKKHV